MEKTCSKCKKIKTNFSEDINRKDNLSPQCKDCVNLRQKTRRENLTQEQKDKEYEYHKNIITRNQTHVYNFLKNNPCKDCGENRVIVLEFDHIIGLKTNTICNMIRNGVSIKKLDREIEKCEIRCANCHRIKTANQFGWNKIIPREDIKNDKELPTTKQYSKVIQEKFWNKVLIKENEEACWIFTSTSKDTEARFAPGGLYSIVIPSKYAYEISFGIVPKDKYVSHRCDKFTCCNPKHLVLTTKKENAQIREIKKRGKMKPNMKLNVDQVREIKKLIDDGKMSITKIAKQYKVSRTTITYIKSGKTWFYVTKDKKVGAAETPTSNTLSDASSY